MKYVQNLHTLNDFNKIIKIYILFSIFIWSLFFITAFFFPILIYFLLAWILVC